MLTVFSDMKGPIALDFLEKDATVNSASCCQLDSENSLYLLNDPHRDIYLYIYASVWTLLVHTLKKTRSRYPSENIIDADYADDLALLTNTPAQAESQLYNQV